MARRGQQVKKVLGWTLIILGVIFLLNVFGHVLQSIGDEIRGTESDQLSTGTLIENSVFAVLFIGVASG
jgi:hypothetical protein